MILKPKLPEKLDTISMFCGSVIVEPQWLNIH